jgi:hypothetical protein
MKRAVLLLTILISLSCAAQETWYGEIAVYGGGGTNDIFRFNELDGAASFYGDGFYTGGLRVRRIVRDWFSVESGIGYSGQLYTMHSAPMPESYSSSGHFGMVTIPVNGRFDFLKYAFADIGIIAGFQTGSYGSDNLSGLGLTGGLGLCYKFKSDIIITARAYTSQFSLLHFIPEDYPHNLSNSGITIGVGYEFIRLGKCHCPEGNNPKRKFF